MKNKRTDRWSPRLLVLTLLAVAVMPLSAFAQGSIFGTVRNSDLSTPANGDISFFGFLDDTDEEIRIESSTGAGYDAGNWFDDFQNYLTESAGNPYDYYFYNIANSQGFHLAKLIPSNSFQQENILLAPVSWPFKPVGVAATAVSSSAVVVDWTSVPGLTYHVYRRVAPSNGSFFRIDDPTGSLANPGVADSFFVDATVNGVSTYDYLIIAEDASGNYSFHSDIVTVSSSPGALTAPVVTSIVPDSGSMQGGTSVVIYGSGFDLAGAGALVGASLTNVTVLSPHEISGITQGGPPGLADVSVVNLASGLASNTLVGGFNYLQNSPPALAPVGPQSGPEGVLLTFTVSATDPDGDFPIMTSSTLPAGATYLDNGDGTGTFDWLPTFVDSGAYNVTFYATDFTVPSLVDSEQVVITVIDAGNQPPILSPIGPQGTTEGVNLNFVITATDADSTFPVLSHTTLPTGAAFVDSGNGIGVFDWTPSFTDSGVYNVTFYATDDSAAIDSEQVVITVAGASNQSPILAAIGPQTVTEGINLNFVVSATDPDATIPALSTSALPTGATFVDSLNGFGVFDWTPDYTQAGPHNVTFYASDGVLIDSEQVVITVNESGNHPPVLDSIGPKFAYEGILLSFIVTASDSDGTIPVLSTSVLPTGATFVDSLNGTGLFQWTPDFLQNGSYDVIFYADDSTAPPVSEIVTIIVSESGDQPPEITPIPDTSVYEGDTLIVNVTAADPEGGAVAIAAYTTMPRTTFVDNGNGTGVLTYRPNYLDAGVDTVLIFATEVAPPYLANSATFVITTLETNQGPIFKPVGPKSVVIGDSLTFIVTATDTTNADTTDNLQFSVQSPPLNSTFVDYGNDSARFTFHPDVGQDGVDTVTFVAVDQGTPQLSATMDVEITVVISNDAPVLDSIGPQTVLEGQTLVVNVTASDPDGPPPVLSVDTLHENATFDDNLNGTGTYTFSPSFLQAGLYGVTFMADDGMDVTEELVLIQVNEAGNQAPVFDPLPSPTVTEGEILTDSLTAQDPEAELVTYDVDTATVPDNFTFVDSGNGVAWFTFAPDFLQAGVYDMTVIASDGDQSTQAVLTVTVQEAGNQPPEISPLSNVTVDELGVVSFPVAASDVDGPLPILSSSTLPGSATFDDLDDDDIYTFEWTTTFDDSGSYSVWFYATDADFPSDVDSAEVIITVNDINRVPWLLIPFGQPDSLMELDTFQFTCLSGDDDGSMPNISLDVNGTGGLLPNMQLDLSWDGSVRTGVLTFNPDYSQGDDNPSYYFLKFHVFDEFDVNLRDSSGTQTIKVYDRNQPPIINFSDSAWPFSINEGQNLTFGVEATDDRDIPSLRAENLPDSNYAINQPTSNIMLFDFTPDFTQAGQYFISFIADDNDGASDTAIIQIDVNEAGNQPPVWSVTLADTTDVFVGFPWSQALSATDPEGTAITLDASPILTNATWDTTGGVGTYYFDPNFTQVGQVYQVTFTATDATAVSSDMVTYLNVQNLLRGDTDGNDKYTLNDVVVLAGYIFRSGEAPYPLDAGDADLSGAVDVADIVYMINFLYHAGPRPPQ